MALTGKITDWALADILQMVATERKSGVLTLEGERGEEVRFHIRNGNITSAHDGRVKPRTTRVGRAAAKAAVKVASARIGGLATYLFETGRINRQQQAQLQRTSSEGDEFETARRAAFLPPAVLEDAINEYAQDLVHWLVTWIAGEYHFVARQIPQPASNLTLSTEGLLLEGMRRIDEVPGIQDVVRHDTVFRRAQDAVPPGGMKPREAAVLALVDGVQGVGRLARAAGLSDHDTAKSLYRLHEARLIEPVALAVEEAPVLDLSVEDLLPVRRPIRILRWASLAFLIAGSMTFRDLTREPADAPTTAYRERRVVYGLQFAQSVFKEAYGREATSIAELQSVGLLPHGTWGRAAQALLAAGRPADPVSGQ